MLSPRKGPHRCTPCRRLLSMPAKLRISSWRGFRDGLDTPEQKYVSSNTDQQKNGGRGERPRKGMSNGDDVAGDDGGGDGRQLISEVQNSAKAAHAARRRDQGWYGPADGRCS